MIFPEFNSLNLKSLAFISKKSDINTTSKYKIISASLFGLPFKSELVNRFKPNIFLRIKKTRTANKTRTASISKEAIKKP